MRRSYVDGRIRVAKAGIGLGRWRALPTDAAIACARHISASKRRAFRSSWPYLFRPSTSYAEKKDVDARDMRGHDAESVARTSSRRFTFSNSQFFRRRA